MRIIGPKGHAIGSFEDWRVHAGPKKPAQWKDGRSAAESARAWCPPSEPCVPSELRELVESHQDIGSVAIETVYPERRVRFDKLRGEPRNADVVAVGSYRGGRIAISVEAKADEPFDLLVGEVLERGRKLIEKGKRTGSVKRVEQLLEVLFGADSATDDHLKLRYQLLTGVAGALAAAREEKAQCAVFIVHEFGPDASSPQRSQNARDFDVFVTTLSRGKFTQVRPGTLLGPIAFPVGQTTIPLYIGKATRVLR